jgi:hypothetical protein
MDILSCTYFNTESSYKTKGYQNDLAKQLVYVNYIVDDSTNFFLYYVTASRGQVFMKEEQSADRDSFKF